MPCVSITNTVHSVHAECRKWLINTNQHPVISSCVSVCCQRLDVNPSELDILDTKSQHQQKSTQTDCENKLIVSLSAQDSMLPPHCIYQHGQQLASQPCHDLMLP